jgi:hypothetical protein
MISKGNSFEGGDMQGTETVLLQALFDKKNQI